MVGTVVEIELDAIEEVPYLLPELREDSGGEFNTLEGPNSEEPEAAVREAAENVYPRFNGEVGDAALSCEPLELYPVSSNPIPKRRANSASCCSWDMAGRAFFPTLVLENPNDWPKFPNNSESISSGVSLVFILLCLLPDECPEGDDL